MSDRAPPAPSLPSRTVLLVDDEEEVRASLARVLEREGYIISHASSGPEGLELLRTQPIRLVISDHNMPGMSGLDFLKLVRERHPNVCRIMLTGDPDPQVIIRSINEGEVYRFIKKPWDNTALRVTVYFAFEALQLEEENRRLVAALRKHLGVVKELQEQFPYLAALIRDEELLLAEADLLHPPD